jgi:hypothetical protein
VKRLLLKRTLLIASILGNILFVQVGTAAEDVINALKPLSMAITSNPKWVLQLPHDGPVVYQGVVSFDEAGTGTNSILYPAPNAAGLMAAVLTHSLLIDSAKKEQKSKLQVAADQVLSPYKDILDHFKYQELMLRTLEKVSSNANSKLMERYGDSNNELVIESTPTFLLTQDQQAIIINDTIIIRKLGKTPEIVFQNNTRIISTAIDIPDATSFWTANDGEKLKEESSKLLAKSIDTAFDVAVANADAGSNPYHTIRYKEGSSEKIERAQVLNEQCDRMLIRTLRGTLMSVPISRLKEKHCDSAPQI